MGCTSRPLKAPASLRDQPSGTFVHERSGACRSTLIGPEASPLATLGHTVKLRWQRMNHPPWSGSGPRAATRQGQACLTPSPSACRLMLRSCMRCAEHPCVCCLLHGGRAAWQALGSTPTSAAMARYSAMVAQLLPGAKSAKFHQNDGGRGPSDPSAHPEANAQHGGALLDTLFWPQPERGVAALQVMLG